MNILLGAPLAPAIMTELGEIGPLLILPKPATRDAFLAEVGATIACLIWPPFVGDLPASLLAKLPALEHIAAMGAGYETIDVVEAARREICVTNTPRAVTEDTADAALFLLLAAVRRFPAAERYLRAGKWTLATPPERAESLRGKTLGIVGFGRIGKAIARRVEPLGLDIVYHARKRRPDAPYPWIDSLQETARRADILVSVLPGGEATRALIGRTAFEALGPEGVFINIGRGAVVDEPALIAALRNGTIAGAGLDVYAEEPAVPAELIAMENVVLLPHVGGATRQLHAAVGRDLIENVRAFSEGREPPDVVPETRWRGRRTAR